MPRIPLRSHDTYRSASRSLPRRCSSKTASCMRAATRTAPPRGGRGAARAALLERASSAARSRRHRAQSAAASARPAAAMRRAARGAAAAREMEAPRAEGEEGAVSAGGRTWRAGGEARTLVILGAETFFSHTLHSVGVSSPKPYAGDAPPRSSAPRRPRSRPHALRCVPQPSCPPPPDQHSRSRHCSMSSGQQDPREFQTEPQAAMEVDEGLLPAAAQGAVFDM